MSEQLASPAKGCPFCRAPSKDCYPLSPSIGRSHWNVFCDDCGAYGPPAHDHEMAARRWDDRP